ncbi:MAG: NAD-dependent epimerase/dehydratase family protein [Candidatus Mcinerneyibacterium aminivorans]|uniref:UDP-glucose 4-epimerase n=1 Tax=Candidatus Mcinerneyibacterium aminivorans TaxID=2703815 RepID=A0A5D0MF23_9BACT|nr:MAG: NAD-dependent epimerase/dehydratase family protein [Candidatus Mcinerneyibacterium aminivorans]
MKILVIGGTVFLGKHIVKKALKRKHDVTIFHRGKHNTEFEQNVKEIFGDRRKEIHKLERENFDYVIDTCGYFPGDVEKSVNVLKGNIDKYLFVSSISVYKNFNVDEITEESPVEYKEEEELENKITNETYGPYKARCERVVRENLKEKSVVVRPGLIAGPGDPSDRFTYWVKRIEKGGKIIAPGKKSKRIQFIDVRDLAEWIIKLGEDKKSGIYNAVGPSKNINMEELLNICRTEINKKARFIWMDENFLLKEEVIPWSDLPLWLPDSMNMGGMMKVSKKMAAENGLSYRKVRDTINDTLKWFNNNRTELKAGLDLEKEKKLIKKYNKI